VAALDHHNICAIYDVGTHPEGGDYIVMQYVEGDTLAVRLLRGRLPADEALNLVGQIAEALLAAHRRGIVHRDLKPHNVVITPDGVAKLLDFGLATFAANSRGAANAATRSGITARDSVVGTPAYMAPEQVRNEPADLRSDVFALGAVLYECLTGRRAFSGATTAETLANVLHVDPPPVSTVVPDLGTTYDVLCGRLLHKNPGERFQSAEEVLGAIRAMSPSFHFSATAIPAQPKGHVVRNRVVALVAASVVIAGAYFWTRPAKLPVAPPDAARLYDMGVTFMREGTYAAARTAFLQAAAVFPDYPQAYSRLAEAHIALDDERSANAALLQVAKLVPNRSRLPQEDALRFDAASAAALRQRDAAVQAYKQLVDRKPDDPGRWLDLGRAQEAAGRLPDAAEAYSKAVALDALSPVALLRVGVIKTRNRETKDGLASIDKAIEQYRSQGRTEGEAEALLRRGAALVTVGRSDEARAALDQVVQLAIESRYPAQRLRAQLELAKLAYAAGKATEAQALENRAVSEATQADLPTLAAAGRLDIGFFLVGRGLHELAEAQLAEGLRIAIEQGATRVENRAKLVQASLRIQHDEPAEAIALATGPEEYFRKSGETRLAVDALLILSRAHEDLEHFEQASDLVTKALAFAEQANDNVRLGGALENQAGQLTKLGRLPEALAVREKINELHRRLKDDASLPRDLTNYAELLILIGRRSDADTALREVEEHIARDEEAYVERKERVAELRMLQAATERRWDEVGRRAAVVLRVGAPAPKGEDANMTRAQRLAKVLAEHALAQIGRSRLDPSIIAKWPEGAAVPGDRREFAYWTGQTLLLRGEVALANQVLTAVMKDPILARNHELAWRLAAVAAESTRRGPTPGSGASIAAESRSSVEQIKAAWAGAAVSYFGRPDLAALMKFVQ
jgi:tetratricopeptide (TPR) repeat protein